MSDALAGKRVILTGAGGGIGRATVRRLAADGAKLALTDRDEEGLEESRRLAGEAGAEVHADAGDLTSVAYVESFVSEAIEALGGLDGVVNNAGRIAGTTIDETSEQLWDELQAINVRSQFFVVKAALDALRSADGGSIVNLSSIAGIVGFPSMTAYCASKAAVLGLTKSLAIDLAEDGIRANAICPASIDTAMPRSYLESVPEGERDAALEALHERHLIKRLGTPDEVANVIAFLISDESSFLTGLGLPIDAGWTAW